MKEISEKNLIIERNIFIIAFISIAVTYLIVQQFYPLFWIQNLGNKESTNTELVTFREQLAFISLFTKACLAYFVFRLSRFLQQKTWITVLFCALSFILFIIPFIALLVGVKNTRNILLRSETDDQITSVPSLPESRSRIHTKKESAEVECAGKVVNSAHTVKLCQKLGLSTFLKAKEFDPPIFFCWAIVFHLPLALHFLLTTFLFNFATSSTLANVLFYFFLALSLLVYPIYFTLFFPSNLLYAMTWHHISYCYGSVISGYSIYFFNSIQAFVMAFVLCKFVPIPKFFYKIVDPKYPSNQSLNPTRGTRHTQNSEPGGGKSG